MSLKSIVIMAMIGCLWHSAAAQNPVNMTLPEGYTLAEIPKQVVASTPDKSINGLYFVSQTDNKVQINYQFKINKVLHQVENYDKLRGIFDLFHKCSTQSLAIKKN